MSGNQKIKMAYIHAAAFPSKEANTFDAIWTADELANHIDITFIVPRVSTSMQALKEYYEIGNTRLKIRSMNLNLIPDRVILRFKNFYEVMIIISLLLDPRWLFFSGKKVVYVREPKELFFWGELKGKNKLFRDWIFVYESHDMLGMDPVRFSEENPLEDDGIFRETLEAAKNFDLLICNTQILADDLEAWGRGEVKPHFITLASPLPRLPQPPQIKPFKDKIILGYIGTIDKYRGVDILLEGMLHLPENYVLRIVGRFRQEKGIADNWLEEYLDDPRLADRIDLNLVDQIDDVAAEIDRCDIVIQPASRDVIDSRYAAPLKSFGYLVRGKPILAGDVLCHRELFADGASAVLYPLDPESFAQTVISLVDSPGKLAEISLAAWHQSEKYNFTRRAGEIIQLVLRGS